MSDSSAFGFGKFVPGFDFLQNLTKGGSGMPGMSHWIAPTVSVEDLQKRIEELKAVQFWLDQNSRALAATVQALEVQKMTLATLKGMNFNMGDIAKAFTVDPMAAMESLRQATAAAAGPAAAGFGFGRAAQEAAVSTKEPPVSAPEPEPQAWGSQQEAEEKEAEPDDTSAQESTDRKPELVDPVQWWGALTQQFQQIAQQALSDAGAREALERTREVATGVAQDAFKTAAEMAGKMTAHSLQQFQQATQAAQAAHAAAQGAATADTDTAEAEADMAAQTRASSAPAAPQSKKSTPAKAASRAASAQTKTSGTKSAARTTTAAAKQPSKSTAKTPVRKAAAPRKSTGAGR